MKYKCLFTSMSSLQRVGVRGGVGGRDLQGGGVRFCDFSVCFSGK